LAGTHERVCEAQDQRFEEALRAFSPSCPPGGGPDFKAAAVPGQNRSIARLEFPIMVRTEATGDDRM
jgi:hypothetical protein